MPSYRRQGAILAGLILAGFCSSGCVHEEVGPAVQTTLTVVRAGEDIELSWPSRLGVVYTVLYNDGRKPGVPWKPLPSAENLEGTDAVLTVRDRAPESVRRYYRLHLGALPSARPR